MSRVGVSWNRPGRESESDSWNKRLVYSLRSTALVNGQRAPSPSAISPWTHGKQTQTLSNRPPPPQFFANQFLLWYSITVQFSFFPWNRVSESDVLEFGCGCQAVCTCLRFLGEYKVTNHTCEVKYILDVTGNIAPCKAAICCLRTSPTSLCISLGHCWQYS